MLAPTAGGPGSDLSAETARTLRAAYGVTGRLLHAVDSEADREVGEAFLADWAADPGLDDADLVVETGDVEAAIERAADCSLLVLGATDRGLLSRLVGGAFAMDVVDDVDCSVVLAERARSRSLRRRLLGDGE